MSVALSQATAEIFHTLGHPVRIQVLELLQGGPVAVRDMLGLIEVESSTLSQQRAVLRRAGVVTARRDGATVVYELGSIDVAELLRGVRRILADLIAGRGELLAELRDADAGRPRPG